MRLQANKNRYQSDYSNDIEAALSARLVGQSAAIDAIVPVLQMYQAGLCPEGRPIGVFMLLGPTGTGKTRTVEALAEVLHGTSKKMLKVDCGEFQMEHEVAKLIGAPPGYMGHRETQPMLNQQKLNSITSEMCDISLVVFDEIEKAAPSLTRILLGVLDKASLRLGDNNTVNFERTMIFLTSNLGARTMQKELKPDFGFEQFVPKDQAGTPEKLQRIGMSEVRRKFSPEFVNRIDYVITYRPLSSESLSLILDQQLEALQVHINRRLGVNSFLLEVPSKTRRMLLKLGTSEEYGARELKRTIQRNLIQPLAMVVSSGAIEPGSRVIADINDARTKLIIRVQDAAFDPAA
ncbi:MAG: ATP-dependent Clp protease ATP-binding subunit [Acidobacteriaceae bacterium]|nr:ATP-dependent Clp protease ATP-binding subunit [Acidobacteriaceae bacterium]